MKKARSNNKFERKYMLIGHEQGVGFQNLNAQEPEELADQNVLDPSVENGNPGNFHEATIENSSSGNSGSFETITLLMIQLFNE